MLTKPWLTPSYGHPTFIVHGIHRRYAGWYNGNPSELFSATSALIAQEVLKLCGSDEVIKRVQKLVEEDKLQLALNIVDFAVKGSDGQAHKQALMLKAEMLEKRAVTESNLIARNIFLNGAKMAKEEADSI